MPLAIIDYGSGNLRSVAKAFERVAGGRNGIRVTGSCEVVRRASHIVLPGVGAYADCMKGLKSLPGMLDTLYEEVIEGGKWFLGICVGMQLLFEKGHEHGEHPGLGWLAGEVVPLDGEVRGIIPSLGAKPAPLKVPHMGWNNISPRANHPLLKGIPDGSHAYFVHSYHAACTDKSNLLATVDYGQKLAAVVGRDNVMGTQFHPEKSQETGLKLLKNFLEL